MKDELIRVHLLGVEKPQAKGEYPDGEVWYNLNFKTKP